MIPTQSKSRFEADPYTWMALRHFLPAPLLRELMYDLVDHVSEGSVGLHDLFEERLVGGIDVLDSWILRIGPADTALKRYLQDIVRSVAWQFDRSPYHAQADEFPAPIAQRVRWLDQALAISTSDFDSAKNVTTEQETPRTLALLAELIAWGPGNVDTRPDLVTTHVGERLEGVSAPLSTLLTKHLGDLFADSDDWASAKALYEAALLTLHPPFVGDWGDYRETLLDLIHQSIASAIRTSQGSKQASLRLRELLSHASLDRHVLLATNAPYDALSAAVSAEAFEDRFDDRTIFVQPPLAHGSFDLEAVEWRVARRRHLEGLQKCWSVLRRQTALGLATESRATKDLFGRTLLQLLETQAVGQTDVGDFLLAVRMLIEGGDDKAVANVRWSETLLDRFLKLEAVELALGVASRHAGAEFERNAVVLEIFVAWTLQVQHDRTEIAERMIAFVSKVAQAEELTNRTANLRRRALEGLLSVVDQRPELARGSMQALTAAVSASLEPGAKWTIQGKGLDIASSISDKLPTEGLLELVKRTLTLLSHIEPAQQLWPVVRPSLTFLASKPVANATLSNAELSAQVVEAIASFGSASRSGPAEVFFLLQQFDRNVREGIPIPGQVVHALDELISTVSSGDKGNLIAEIQALLLIPAFAGAAGVNAALDALEAVLARRRGRRPSELASVYSCILTIAGRRAEFEPILGEDTTATRWGRLLDLVISVWAEAAKDPAVFVEFAIPIPKRPSNVTIHNWTYASMRLANDIGRESEMLSVLALAAGSPDLNNAINFALSSGARSDAIGPDFDATLKAETSEAFYAAVGRRIARLHALPETEQSEQCSVLLRECLVRGPRGLDAAVFTKARDLRVKALDVALVDDYLVRAERTTELRFSLPPLLKEILPASLLP